MKEKEHEQNREMETPAYTSNMSGDDILGRSDLYLNPLAAMFTQNTVVAPAALTGIPPDNPYFLDEWKNDGEEEDKLRR